MISMVVGMLMTCLLPLGAQTLSWKSTSAMQDMNSGFTPRITEVEAHRVAYIPMRSTSTMRNVEAITTPDSEDSGSSHKGGIRKGFITPGDPGEQSEESPIGEPWALLLFAAAFAGVVARRQHLRTQKAAEE